VRTGMLLVLGLLLVVVGGTWTFQGLGYVTGSPMTGVAAWAIIGPLVAGLGVALVIVAVRGRRGKSPHS
jgi:membrane associated rhomboid family serine protease